jgi:phosphopantothenoylcysteine decarboxylase/phosphopantothenate--cysteine ligase
MYQHQTTADNIKKLESFGNTIIQAASGELASGLDGQGRMQEPEVLLKEIESFFNSKKKFQGKKVIITAGPTHEAIDPVRFIGNHSSGKMGYAVAKSFIEQGAQVILISGPSALNPPVNLSIFLAVKNAQEMYDAAKKHYKDADITILAAAVADYRPKHIAKEKIKKTSDAMTIEMEKTVDIAKSLGEIKQRGQINVGFALETENEESNAKKKLENKNFDLIVLNSLKDENAAFGYDTNKVKIFNHKGLVEESGLIPKSKVADLIVNQIHNLNSKK